MLCARVPTSPSIAQGASLVDLGSNPAVEDHLLGHGDRRRHRDRRRRRHGRRTAAAPPHCWGASCQGLLLRYVEVNFGQRLLVFWTHVLIFGAMAAYGGCRE